MSEGFPEKFHILPSKQEMLDRVVGTALVLGAMLTRHLMWEPHRATKPAEEPPVQPELPFTTWYVVDLETDVNQQTRYLSHEEARRLVDEAIEVQGGTGV